MRLCEEFQPYSDNRFKWPLAAEIVLPSVDISSLESTNCKIPETLYAFPQSGLFNKIVDNSIVSPTSRMLLSSF